MKNVFYSKKVLSVIVGTLVLTAVIFAQSPGQEQCKGKGKGHMNIPDLTQEQQAKFDDLRVPHMQVITSYRAEMNVLDAQLKQLQIADKPDSKSIDSKIDEVAAVRAKMEKERSKHHQVIRSLLTPAQKVYFDANFTKGSKNKGNGECNKHDGKHNGNGSGQNCQKNQKL